MWRRVYVVYYKVHLLCTLWKITATIILLHDFQKKGVSNYFQLKIQFPPKWTMLGTSSKQQEQQGEQQTKHLTKSTMYMNFTTLTISSLSSAEQFNIV